jgi:gamma-glutamylcysteine synthetase
VGTVEIRPACQQPPDDSWAAGALALGLAEAHREAAQLLEDRLGPAPWSALLRYRSRAVRDGIRAEQPADGFLDQVLELAGEGLRRRGLGEERYLAPLRERLARGIGPADRARAEASVEGLVSELAVS